MNIETKFTVSEEPSNSTEVFVDLNERMNLVNSKIFQSLERTSKNIIYLRSNKLGTRNLKFTFEITVSQKIDEKELKDKYTQIK